MDRSEKVVAIIQARMGSTRLPKKVLREFAGSSILDVILERISLSNNLDQIVLATTINDIDDKLEQWANKSGVLIHRGSEDDVLERFYESAKAFHADIIVRITADDPLKDAEIIDECLSYFYNDKDLDYCSNTLYPSYPEGLDIEAFRFRALEKAWKEAKLRSEREHVTPYIWKNENGFKIKQFSHDEDLSNWRWTVDNQTDFEFMQIIFN